MTRDTLLRPSIWLNNLHTLPPCVYHRKSAHQQLHIQWHAKSRKSRQLRRDSVPPSSHSVGNSACMPGLGF